MKGLSLIWITAALVVVSDQITKAMVSAWVSPYEMIAVIPGVFNLVNWLNTGAAFGIFSSSAATGRVLLIAVTIVSLVVIGFLIKTARTENDKITTFALSLIGGGAVGNLIDRVRLGSVIDFLDFYVGSYHWPAFNIADSAITIGVVLTLAGFFLKKPSKKG